MTQNIRFSVDGDGIALLAIDVAGRPMNVLTPGFQADLTECIDKVASDPGIKGAVIASAKSSFMAGADIKDMVGAFARGTTAAQAADFSYSLHKLFRRMETCGKPIAAAINGVALGGGFELALACHYRVIEDGPKAGVGLPEVTIGLLPGGGGTQRVPRLIGIPEALRMITEGKQLAPADALKKGLVNEVAPAAEIVERARQWILKGGEGVQPWDKQGLQDPRWRRADLAGGRAGIHGSVRPSRPGPRCATTRRRSRSCRASTRARRCRSSRDCASSRSTSASCWRVRWRAT